MHICCCGCGHQAVTPLRPNRWSITFDGEAVSLAPSVGSAGLACRSHYFIRRNEVVWCRDLSLDEVTRGQVRDGWQQAETSKDAPPPRRPWSRLRSLFR
ncbi:DUF6527 family protein [Occultella gossypii]|uniref:DUF6527 family protein n=1 Tax=Occultella gossypii TaxID=2800820 RepID=UPI003556D9F8